MSCELGFSSVVNNHLCREQESRALQLRRRNILYLIAHYLRSEGLGETLRSLQEEARLTSEYQVCDNVDLACILQEYEDYYFLRFNKHPKLTKKMDGTSEKKVGDPKPSRDLKRGARVKSAPGQRVPCPPAPPPPEELLLDSVLVSPALSTPPAPRSLDLPSPLEFPEDWRPYIELISQEIVTRDLTTRWRDVIGLDRAKQLLREALVLPVRYPELCRGLLSPWRGLLLHGPPGNGKTLLARAAAAECGAVLFNISPSSLVSKWRGDSERLVRVLFTLARRLAPAAIFLDEVDALLSTRGGEEHEASRRLKAELLSQLDGMHTGEAHVFLLATCNVPWDLDPALLRRFEKRVLVDLPDQEARAALLRHYLPPLVLEQPRLCAELDYAALARATEHYSGSDIRAVAKEAAMQRLRDTCDTLERMPHGHVKSIKLKTITTEHVLAALHRIKPCADYKQRYDKWQKDFGAT